MLHALSNSTVHINDKPTERLHYDYEIEPQDDLLISMPRCMYYENKTLRICSVNANDGYVIIKKAKGIEEAETVDQVKSQTES